MSGKGRVGCRAEEAAVEKDESARKKVSEKGQKG